MEEIQQQDNGLYARYNYDDVFNRVVIVGLLYLLNHELVYDQIWDTNVVERVHVPFMYDFGSSDERFAQDNYTFFGQACFADRKIDGKFDMLPRGAVKYTGSQIDAANFTNRFVPARYLKNENGKLTSYIAYMASIPLTFNFECEMWIDNMDTAFKIEQGLREIFYKNRRYDVLYRGMKISCRCGFPESHNLDKTVSYAFDSERQLKLSFSLVVETYQPAFYNYNKNPYLNGANPNANFGTNFEIEASKKIERVAWDIETRDVNEIIQSVKLSPLATDCIYPSGTNMYIEWTYRSNVSDMCTVCLYWYDTSGVKHLIDSPMLNKCGYIWSIPKDFSGYIHPTITFDDYTNIITPPDIRIIPNKDNYIDKSSFIIIDPGVFIGNAANGKISFTLDYRDSNGKTYLSTSYSFNTINGQIDLSDPVNIDGEKMKYTEKVTPKRITLELSYPLNPSVNDKISNILIL